jgi:3-oxoacyl-[acyl-carrier-protein] synthase-3
MTNMGVRIRAASYAVPPDVETVDAIMERERERIDAALRPLGARARQQALESLGLSRVHVCGARQPYDLALEAATNAVRDSGIRARDIHLIIDYSTLPGEGCQHVSFAHKISADLGAETSMNLSFKAGGCGGLHLALKTALGWMATDDAIRTALLVTGDTPPTGNRSMLPITVQGDAGSAVVLSRDGATGPVLLGVEALTLGHLHEAISLRDSAGRPSIQVDALRMEAEVMPIYFLNLFRLVHKVLGKASLGVGDVSHFIYSNISQRDREGFRKALGLSDGKLPPGPMLEFGHTFASDLIINYVELRKAGCIHPGELLLFASAGIGFTWGVTLARA